MKRQFIAMLMLLLIISLFAYAPLNSKIDSKPSYASDLIKIKLSAEVVYRANLPTELYAEKTIRE